VKNREDDFAGFVKFTGNEETLELALIWLSCRLAQIHMDF